MRFCYVANDNASLMRATLPARYLIRAGHKVDLILITVQGRQPYFYGGRPKGLTVHEVPRSWGSPRRVVQLLRQLKPEIIHAIGTGRATFWPGLWYRQQSGDSMLVTDIDELLSAVYNLPRNLIMRRWEARALRDSDIVLVVSRYMEGKFSTRAGKERIGYLPNAVDLEVFDKYKNGSDLIRKRFGGRPIVTYMGFMLPQYQTGYILQVAHVIQRQRPDVQFVLIGEGPEKVRLEKLAVRLGLRDSVCFVGFVSDEELPGYLCASDALLFPIEDTQINQARSPNKTYLYCAAEVPIVTNRVGEVYNTLGDWGIYFDFDSLDDCATKVLKAVDTGQPRPPRSLAEKNCWAKRTEEYLAIVGR